MVVIHRNSLLDNLRSYNVVIDGDYCGKIKCGETKQFDLKEGEHTLCLKIDWCRSPKINFSLKDDETVFFDCGNYASGWKHFLFPLYVTFFRSKYLFLKEVGSLNKEQGLV